VRLSWIEAGSGKQFIVDEEAHRVALIRQGVDLPVKGAGGQAAGLIAAASSW